MNQTESSQLRASPCEDAETTLPTKILWKPFPLQEPDGSFRMYGAHRLNAEPTTLQRIMNMPAGKTISLRDACSLHHIHIMEVLEEGGVFAVMDPENDDWICWISKQGFKISLTGDEFEVLGSTSMSA